MSDLELLQLWRTRHDAEAFRGIVVRYGPMVYGTCARVLRNSADAEDVTQDCFVHLAEHGHRVRKSLGAWLHRLAYHRSLDKIKKESRRSAREQRYASERTAHSEQSWNDLEPLIDEAIASLPDPERDVIVAYFLRQEKQEAVAEQLGVSRRTVSKRTQRGIAAIREHLRRGGVTIPTASLVTLVLSRTADAVPADTVVHLGKIALGHAPTGGMVAGGLTLAKALWFSAVAVVVVAGFVGTRSWMGQGEEENVPAGSGDTSSIAAADVVYSPFVPIASAVSNLESIGYGDVTFAATEEAETNSAPQTMVTGKVFERYTRDPLVGVDVVAQVLGETKRRVSTDSEGNYAFADLPLGVYRLKPIRASLLGNEDGYSVKVELTAEARVREVHLQMTQHALVSGYVLDARGMPVEGATVFGQARDIHVGRRVTSDSSGAFRFENIPSSDRLVLEVRKPGFGFRHIGPLRLSGDGLEDIVVRAEAESIVRGAVVDPAGAPLQGVTVHMSPKNMEPGTWRGWSSGKSDLSGRFEVVGLHSATWEYGVDETGTYHLQDSIEVGTSETIDGFTIVYEPKPRINTRIRVSDRRGRPIPGVDLYADGTASTYRKLGVSNEWGEFVVPNLIDYRINVYARSDDFVGSESLELRAKDSSAEIILEPWGAISGRVVDDTTGRPVQSYKTRLPKTHDNSWGESFDVDGRFFIEKVPPGDQVIAVGSNGFVDTTIYRLRVPEGGTLGNVEVRLVPAMGTVRARVVDENGVPIHKAVVSVERTAETGPGFQEGTQAWSGKDGRFVLVNLPRETRSLRITHSEFATALVTLESLTGDGIPREIVLMRGATIQGKASLDGVPLADLIVQIGDERPASLDVKTNSEGVFYLKAMDPGTHQVLLRDSLKESGWAISIRRMAEVTIVGQEEVTVNFDYTRWPTRVEGKLTRQGQPVGSRMPVLLVYDTPGYIEDSHMGATEADGSFVLEGIPPGPATLHVWDQFERPSFINVIGYPPRKLVDITLDGVTQIEFDLPAKVENVGPPR